MVKYPKLFLSLRIAKDNHYYTVLELLANAIRQTKKQTHSSQHAHTQKAK